MEGSWSRWRRMCLTGFRDFHIRTAGFRGKGVTGSGQDSLKNSGFRLPAKKITVNLSPAGIRKGGTAYDLPIAVAILGAFQVVGTDTLEDSMVIGELGWTAG